MSREEIQTLPTEQLQAIVDWYDRQPHAELWQENAWALEELVQRGES